MNFLRLVDLCRKSLSVLINSSRRYGYLSFGPKSFGSLLGQSNCTWVANYLSVVVHDTEESAEIVIRTLKNGVYNYL